MYDVAPASAVRAKGTFYVTGLQTEHSYDNAEAAHGADAGKLLKLDDMRLLPVLAGLEALAGDRRGVGALLEHMPRGWPDSLTRNQAAVMVLPTDLIAVLYALSKGTAGCPDPTECLGRPRSG